MSQLTESLTAIAIAIVGVAILAVIVSQNSNTTGVISATGSAFSQSLATALSPITGTTSGSTLGGSGLSAFPIS